MVMAGNYANKPVGKAICFLKPEKNLKNGSGNVLVRYGFCPRAFCYQLLKKQPKGNLFVFKMLYIGENFR